MAPRFPSVPASPFWSGDAAAARAALEAIGAWRARLVAWLEGGERDDGISPALATLLLELLGARVTEGYRRHPYRLAPFPAVLGDPDPCADLRKVLLWRAGVVDFVDDVWDTVGEADFGIEECQRVGALLSPASMLDDRTCRLCLDTPSEDARATHYERCAVQASWRE